MINLFHMIFEHSLYFFDPDLSFGRNSDSEHAKTGGGVRADGIGICAEFHQDECGQAVVVCGKRSGRSGGGSGIQSALFFHRNYI